MVDPDALLRPSATELLLDPLVNDNKDKQSISRLKEELNRERLKSESLTRLLKRKGEGEDTPDGKKKVPKLHRANTMF